MSTAIRQSDPWSESDAPAPVDGSCALDAEGRRALAIAREHLARANSSLALAERCMTDLSSRLHSLQRRMDVDDAANDEPALSVCDRLQRQIDVAMESLTSLAGTTMAAGYEADAAARCAATALASIGALDQSITSDAPAPRIHGQTVGLLQTVAPSHLGDSQTGRLSSITRQGCNSVASGHATQAQSIVRIAVNQMASLHDDLLHFKGATLGPLQRQLEQAHRTLDVDTI